MKRKEINNGVNLEINVLKDLDEEQRAAVIDDGGTSLVVAGPGSGKTNTITHKIAYLVLRGIHPREILLVTFTKAAAREMIARAQCVSKNPLDGMMAGTFHHVCNQLLRKHAEVLHLPKNFSIMDEEDAESLIKIAISQTVDHGKFPTAKMLRKVFSLSSNLNVDVEDIVRKRFQNLVEISNKVRAVKERYEEMKAEQALLDFDDLLVYTNQLLDVKKVREEEASRFKWVLVDEFQDTNKIQYEIVKKLSSVHGNLMVVGDDAQSIYSFRGARYENIFELMNEREVKLYKIQTNYRSTPEIVSLVNFAIPNNVFQKELRSVNKHGERPVVVKVWDANEEAQFVASKIEELIKKGLKAKDMAILYRAHSHSLEMQVELSKRGIPFHVRSGMKFVQSKHVKDVLAFLRIVNNPRDEVSWMRALQLFTGVGKKGAQRIVEFIREESLEGILKIGMFGKKYEDIEKIFKGLMSCDNPSSMVKYVYENFYFDYISMTFQDPERRADIEALMDMASRYQDVNAFLVDLAITEDDEFEELRGSVTLTTVHQAKGLEWDTVFVISLGVGKFPSFMGIKSGNLDEEKRIFYVAITRAKKRLFLCKRMGESNFYGMEEYDFIESIPPSLYDQLG